VNPFDLMGQFAHGIAGTDAALALLAVPALVAFARSLRRGNGEVDALKSAGMGALMMVIGWMLCSALIMLPVAIVGELFNRMPAGELERSKARAQAEFDAATCVLNAPDPVDADAKRMATFYEGKSKAAKVIDKAQKRMDKLAARKPLPEWIQGGALALTFLTPFAFFVRGQVMPSRLPVLPSKVS